MKLNLHALMKSTPNFKIDTRLSPVSVDGQVSGSFKGSVGAISAHIDAIPVKLAVPFMKRRKRLTVIAMIGGFDVKINPFTVSIEDASLRMNGILGPKGIDASIDCKVDCRTEMEVNGKVCGKIGAAAIDLGDDDVHCESGVEKKRGI